MTITMLVFSFFFLFFWAHGVTSERAHALRKSSLWVTSVLSFSYFSLAGEVPTWPLEDNRPDLGKFMMEKQDQKLGNS